jgi:RHS repeat-associated protein
MGAENVYEYSYKGNQRIRQKIRRCPGGTTEIFNYLYDDAGNLVLVDDDSPNILENPGFETGNYAPEWVAWSGDGNYNWTVTSENSQEGKYSLYSPSYKSTSSMELLIQNHSLAEVSDTFTVSVWVKTVFLTGGVKIMVDFWDDEWGYLGGKSSNTITLNNNWTKLSVTINPGDIPSGAVNFKFNIVRKKGQGKLWVDNARCESGTERTPEIRYIYAGNRLLATENDGNLYFYHLDRIGSPIMLTNKSGSIVKQKVYEAFGNLKWQSGTYSDNREFTGKEKDPTGFHYFGARYYSGDIGRFLSPDPHTLNPKNIELSDPQVLNPYVYSRNNPIQYKDPNGKYYVDAFTGQIVKPNTVYETMMNLMPAILGGKDLAVPFYKGGGDELVDVLRVGPSTKVRVESPFKGKGYMEYPFMQYKASPFVAGGKLGLIGVQSIGREFGTGKNVLQLNIKATKSLGKVEVEGVEGEKILEEEVMTLTGTKDQLETQLDTWGYELYQENENFDSWEVREKEKR